MRRRYFPLILCLVIWPTDLMRAGVNEDWAAVAAFDAGPKKKPASREEAVLLARNHFLAQRKAIQIFLTKYPSDQRAFDARLRLANIFATEGKMDGDSKKIQEAISIYEAVQNAASASPIQKADASFYRVSLYMQNQKGNTPSVRENLLRAAQGFVSAYPGDRRGPRLLVEVATVFDESPLQKRQLLEQASTLSNEESLRARIADDLKRIDRLGQPVDFTLNLLSGGTLNVSTLRGNVVLILFWAADSPPCLLWLRDFRKIYPQLSQAQLKIVTVSLDTNPQILKQRVNEFQLSWPTHYDGKGWESSLPRSLGINTLPTVWILDKKGILRSLNARSNYEAVIRQLQRE